MAVVALISVGGCNSGDGDEESQTPRITAGPVTEFTGTLLTTKDLRSVRGLPRDIEAVAIEELELFENPDPRGPCGAKVLYPDFAQGQGVGLRSANTEGFEAIFKLPPAQATALAKSVAADTRMGCPPHKSKTNTGSVQQARLLKEVDIGSLGDQQTAAVLRIANKGQTGHVAMIIIQDTDRVALLVLFARAQAPDEVVKALARRASDRLKGGG